MNSLAPLPSLCTLREKFLLISPISRFAVWCRVWFFEAMTAFPWKWSDGYSEIRSAWIFTIFGYQSLRPRACSSRKLCILLKCLQIRFLIIVMLGTTQQTAIFFLMRIPHRAEMVVAPTLFLNTENTINTKFASSRYQVADVFLHSFSSQLPQIVTYHQGFQTVFCVLQLINILLRIWLSVCTITSSTRRFLRRCTIWEWWASFPIAFPF